MTTNTVSLTRYTEFQSLPWCKYKWNESVRTGNIAVITWHFGFMGSLVDIFASLEDT